MILLTALLAGAAAALFLGPPVSARIRRLGPVAEGPRDARRPVAVTVAVLAAAGVLVTWALAGALAGVTAVVGAEAAGTAAYLLSCRRSRRAAHRARTEVARACAAIAGQVRVGRVASDALAVTARDFPVLALASRTQDLGGDLVAVLRTGARRPGHAGLADLASAWQLAQATGAPLAAVLEQVADALRADQGVQRTVSAELAGPRATGSIMAVLPFGGIGMGYLLGGDPVGFLLAGPVGWMCLAGGVTLACCGVVWIDRLARVAELGWDTS